MEIAISLHASSSALVGGLELPLIWIVDSKLLPGHPAASVASSEDDLNWDIAGFFNRYALKDPFMLTELDI